jgi:hypothetical protein
MQATGQYSYWTKCRSWKLLWNKNVLCDVMYHVGPLLEFVPQTKHCTQFSNKHIKIIY